LTFPSCLASSNNPIFGLIILRTVREDPGFVEKFVREYIRKDGEPLVRVSKYDNARTFYVGLSRAEKVLILPYYKGRGQRTLAEFKPMLDEQHYTNLSNCDWSQIPEATYNNSELPKVYSFTGDFIE